MTISSHIPANVKLVFGYLAIVLCIGMGVGVFAGSVTAGYRLILYVTTGWME